MARPLREQFAIATFVLLVPVGAVMTLRGRRSHAATSTSSRAKHRTFAQTVAAHIEMPGQRATAVACLLELLPLPENSTVTITDDKGGIHSVPKPGRSEVRPGPSSGPTRGRAFEAVVRAGRAPDFGGVLPRRFRTRGPRFSISGMATLDLPPDAGGVPAALAAGALEPRDAAPPRSAPAI